jgi:hypothetical protein
MGKIEKAQSNKQTYKQKTNKQTNKQTHTQTELFLLRYSYLQNVVCLGLFSAPAMRDVEWHATAAFFSIPSLKVASCDNMSTPRAT